MPRHLDYSRHQGRLIALAILVLAVALVADRHLVGGTTPSRQGGVTPAASAGAGSSASAQRPARLPQHPGDKCHAKPKPGSGVEHSNHSAGHQPGNGAR